MSDATVNRPGAVIFGARNLGRAIIDALVADGWGVTGVARSDDTLQGVADAGATPLRGDITDPASVAESLRAGAEAHGRVDLAVNAASAYGGTRSGPFGGGPIADAAADAFDAWGVAPARSAFSFLSAAGRFALDQGGPATLVQATGGSARRAMPGLWAAGAFGVRAITSAAAQELREHGVHVALLIIDAGIEPLSGLREGQDRDSSADPRQIADAVRFLATQGARAATHELQVTPLAERWVP
jgi:NADP-dependent 3-hydroxy acid dehydrogenase YdfG